MNMKTRLKRGAIGAMLALLVFGAGAFAQDVQRDVPVNVSSITGNRTLQVVGANTDGAPSVGGPALLGFGTLGTEAPFGTIVTDLMYDRHGYHLYTELSDLFPLDGQGVVDCSGDRLNASAFTVTPVDQGLLDPTDVDGVLETLLSFADTTDLADRLTSDIAEAIADLDTAGVLDLDLTSTIVQVDEVPGLIPDVTDAFTAESVLQALGSLELMSRAQGTGGNFEFKSEHPRCPETLSNTPSTRYLEHASANDPDSATLQQLRDAIFAEAAGADTSLDVLEAGDVGLILEDPDSLGLLYQAVESEVRSALAPLEAVLNDPLLSTLLTTLGLNTLDLDAEIDLIVQNVIDGLRATTAGLLEIDLVRQTGAYPAVHVLQLDRDALQSHQSGSYHGVMTVTLVNDPDNDGGL